MKRLIAAFLLMQPASVASDELRCGWYANPTPANHWLEDADGMWILAVQGGYQVWDSVDLPETSFAFNDQWVTSNGAPGHAYYGHGCACISGTFDPVSGQVQHVSTLSPKPLEVCRADPKLPAEPIYE